MLDRTPITNLAASASQCTPHPLSPIKINTSKTVSKQTTLSPFRMNTYRKQGEGYPIIVNQTAHEGCLSRVTVGSEGSLLNPTRIPVLPAPNLSGRSIATHQLEELEGAW